MGIYVTSCDLDSSYYPMDQQTCSIVLTTWGATAEELIIQDVQALYETSNTIPYQENGVWELKDTSFRIYKEYRESSSYNTIEFTYVFNRRARYYVLIIMLPVILLSLLCCGVFILPPDAGEKVGFSLTVLLSYAVYLSLIAEAIPETSLTLSILSMYI